MFAPEATSAGWRVSRADLWTSADTEVQRDLPGALHSQAAKFIFRAALRGATIYRHSRWILMSVSSSNARAIDLQPRQESTG
jgi:hypothetical protein